MSDQTHTPQGSAQSQAQGTGREALCQPLTTGEPASLASLYAKMALIMGELSRLEKKGHNTHFNYAYVLQEDVYDQVRVAMSKHKLAFFPMVTSVERAQIEYTSYDKRKIANRTTVNYLMTFADGETGATISLPWSSDAIDDQDKAQTKASAQAVKYFLLRTFIMSAGDDLDPDSQGDQGHAAQGKSKQASQSKSAPDKSAPGKSAPGNGKAAQTTGQGQAQAQTQSQPGSHDQFAPSGPKDWETYYLKTAPHFGLDKGLAASLLKEHGNNALAAFEYLKSQDLPQDQPTQPAE